MAAPYLLTNQSKPLSEQTLSTSLLNEYDNKINKIYNIAFKLSDITNVYVSMPNANVIGELVKS